MKPRLALLLSAVLATSFATTGCTIYTYDTPPKTPKKTSKAKTSKRPGQTLIKPGTMTNQPGTTDPVGEDETPVVTTTIWGSGKTGVFEGEAFVIPENTARLPNLDDLVPFARLYTNKFDVAPQTFTGGFPGALLQDEWFAIRYQGKIAAAVEGDWSFRLNSDDGAILYIDDVKVIDNDGVHTAASATGKYHMTVGQHMLRLEYFQERKGSVALQLYTVVNGRDVLLTGVP